MATSPTGNWSEAIDHVRTNYANVSAFRDWITPPNASQVSIAAAKARAHVQEKSRGGLIWPLIIIKNLMPEWGDRGSAWEGAQRLTCDVFYEMKITESLGTPDEFYALTNPVGAINSGLIGLANLTITPDFERLDNPHLSGIQPPRWGSEGEQVTEGDMMSCAFRLTFGRQ